MAENKFQTQDMMSRCVPMASVQAVLAAGYIIPVLFTQKITRKNPPDIRADTVCTSRKVL